MLPSGTPSPMGGPHQSVPTSLLRSTSGLLGTQGGQIPAQSAFPPLLSPRTQFNNINMLGNTPNVSSLLQQSLGNGIPNSTGAEPDPMSNMGNGMNFSSPPSSMVQLNMSNPISTGQILSDQQPSQNLDPQMFQHSQQTNNHHQQQQYQSIRGLNSVGQVKLEPQAMNDQHSQLSHQLHQSRNMGSVKLEPQQLQNNRNLPPVKMEPQNSDQSLFLHHHQQQQQQQQQQQLLHMSRQSPQAAAAQINYLHQQRIMQLQQQQQQQQQALKSVPLQRALSQPQFQQQNLPLRSNVRPVYEPGMCARRLTRYMYEQQHRPEDNDIEFWRKYVSEFFAPNAKKKWCVSLYGSGRQTTGVFPQDVWHCEICNRKPGRGFEATAEVLPRLFKIKYESGTLEELLYVDMPREYQNNSGQIVLDYAKAIQESVFDQLRVVRDGQLRIVFSPDLKICSWEFCARRHEELIPRRLLIPQVSQLGAAAQKYQAATQSASSNMSSPELQNYCNIFVASARQLAKAVEVPLVNDLGYTKRYVRCLQISEVVNSMKDLIDYSRETGTGPMQSLAKFPRRTSSTTCFPIQPQIKEEPNLQQQQTVGPSSSNNNHNSSVQANAMEIASTNGVPSVNNSHNTSTTSSTSTVAGLLPQSSMNSCHQNPMNNNQNGSYIGNGIAIPNPNSSSILPQPNPSPFQSSTSSTSNNNTIQVSHSQHDVNDSQSSVQKIIQEMMISPHMNRGNGMVGPGNAGNTDVKFVNGMSSTSNINGLNGGNGLVGNGFGQSPMLNGIRAAMGNNAMSMNGRVGMAALAREHNMNQQQGLGDQFLSGLGAVNGFNNLQFDWKPSP